MNVQVLTEKDFEIFRKIKSSPVYSTYLMTIYTSAKYRELLTEYLSGLDIKSSSIIPESLEKLSQKQWDDIRDVVKSALSRISLLLVTDASILSDIARSSVEETAKDLSATFYVNYMLGLCDKEFYDEATRLVESKTIDANSPITQGLLNYLKRNSKNEDITKVMEYIVKKKAKKDTKVENTNPIIKESNANISTLNVEL